MAIKLVFIILSCLAACSHGAKVMVVPMNMGSHILYHSLVGAALAEEGHEVVIYIPSNNHVPKGLSPKLKFVQYKVTAEVPFGNSEMMADLEIQAVLEESLMEWIHIQEKIQVEFFEANKQECDALYDIYPEIEAEGFDVAIMDGVNYVCFLTIPYKLGIPYITLGIPFGLWANRIPHLSSQFPLCVTTFTDKMDFWQRLSAFSMDVMDHIFVNETDEACRRYVPEKPIKGDGTLLTEATMIWHLYDISVGYPKPLMPNMLDVGDIMSRPANPLTPEYELIMNESSKKVVYVSLGSHFDHIPQEWLEKFCKAFNNVKYTVIWKLKVQPPCKLGQHVHAKKWVPQNDLLAHPKLGLFITHCGINSMFESVSHGKPMIGVPVTLDQPYNGVLLQERRYGKLLSLKAFTADEMIEAINEVMENNEYQLNVEKASNIMKSKPESPAKRMSFWVDYIVKFGGAHLRTNAHELNVFEFLMIDIYLFILVVFLVMVIFALVFCYCCLKCFRRIFCNKEKKMKTQ